MSTRRQNILSNIQTALAEITELTTVEINRVLPVTSDATMPIAIISSGSEAWNKSESSLGSELWEWDIPIIIITKTTDLEDLLGLIQAKLLTDQSRDGNADMTRRIGAFMEEDFNLSNAAQAMNVVYQITYEVEEGSV